jgi:hypothetical protein
MTQLTLNAKISNTTKVTSFFANFGKKSNLFDQERRHLAAQLIIKRVATLKKIHDNIALMQIRLAKYQNKKRKMAPQLKEKDKMYLLTKNLKIRKKSKKLDHVKVGSFLIKEVKKSVNYELDLLKDARVFSVFHVSLLESVDPSTPIQKTFHYKSQEKNRFEVERILKKKGQQYLVKWKGYPTTENTWKPKRNLDDCDNLIRKFHQDQENQRSEATSSENPKIEIARRKHRREAQEL